MNLEPTDPYSDYSKGYSRAVSTGAASIPVIVTTNDDGGYLMFLKLQIFADGETETDLVVTFPDAAEGVTYKISVSCRR